MLVVKEDDYELMRAVAKRDQRAFTALYDRHSNLVYTICLRILRDRAEAEELLVDVFYEVWDKCDRYDATRGSPVTYLVTLARSRAIDRIRSKGRRKELALADTDQPAAADNPAQQTIKNERATQIAAALEQLEPAQRQAIECSFYDGLSHSEIAQKLDKPLGTIKTWIRQGLIRLRDSLRTT